MIIALAALVVALVAIGGGVWHFRWAGAKAERVAVMVLPFTNLSGDSSVNPLAEAVTDGLTDTISRFFASFSPFQVIASDTANTYAGKPIDVKQIGKDLGLRYVLQGSLQPAETRVRVSTQLIDGESGVQLWAESFDEDRADLLQMEDEIVARVVNGLKMRVADIEAERVSRAQPGSPMALALRCVAGAGNFAAEAVDPEKRAELFKPCDEALRLDPHNVVALGVRAVWLLDGVDRAQSADREGDLRRAKEDVTTLLAINPHDPYANAYKVYLLRLEGRPDEAIAEGERSVALNPGFVQTYFYLCSTYTDAGQPEKAIDCVDNAVRLSPHDSSLYGLADDQGRRAGSARTRSGGVGLGAPHSRSVAGQPDRAASRNYAARDPGARRRSSGSLPALQRSSGTTSPDDRRVARLRRRGVLRGVRTGNRSLAKGGDAGAMILSGGERRRPSGVRIFG